MLKTSSIFLALVLSVAILVSYSIAEEIADISVEQAIKVATKEAARNKFDTSKTDIEVLKVKKGLEKGPIRMVTLVRHFPKDMATAVISREYWVVYFYPKGQMEKADTLGGDFITLIDLHSGEVISTLPGM